MFAKPVPGIPIMMVSLHSWVRLGSGKVSAGSEQPEDTFPAFSAGRETLYTPPCTLNPSSCTSRNGPIMLGSGLSCSEGSW